jgi:hypothetical protein
MRLTVLARLSRWWPLGLGCLAAFAGLPGPAAAQTSSSTFAIKQFREVRFDNEALDLATKTKLTTETRFNQVRCECTANQRRVRVEIEITTDRSNTTESYFVVAGANCLDSEQRIVQDANQCVLVSSGRIGNQETNIVFEATVRQLMPGGCTPDRKSLALTVYVGQDQTAVRKLEPALAYEVDGKPPTAPLKSADPSGGENLATVSFKAGSTSEQDVRYQLLCARLVDGAIAGPWRSTASKTPIFSSPATACSTASASSADAGVSSAALTSGDAGAADGGATDARALDGGIADARAAEARSDAAVAAAVGDGSSGSASGLLENPLYVCSDSVAPGSLSITGLTDGQAYRFYVVAVDRAGNTSAPVDLGTTTPVATQDLWERYLAQGGKGQGGYGCATAAHTRGGVTLLLVGGALLLLALARGQRRSQRRAARQGRRG